MDSPDIKRGDSEGFERFALQIRALVGMLQTLGTEGKIELRCGSHVSRLLSKLPTEMRSEFRRHMCRRSNAVYDLIEFSEWLQVEAWCQTSDGQKGAYGHKDKALPKQDYRRESKPARSATILHGAEDPPPTSENVSSAQTNRKGRSGAKAYCPYCDTEDHFLSQCATFKCFDKAQMTDWIKTNKRCWRCGRSHQAAQCNLKKPCSKCQGKHLLILHEVNSREPREGTCLVSSATETLYLDKPSDPTRVLLKVIRVLLRHGDKTLDTYAVLDDGSDRTMLLTAAAQQLEVTGTPEDISLRTIRQDIQVLHGASVSFEISPTHQPKKSYKITNAFTAQRLGLAEHSYPIATLKRKYKHLTNLPLQAFSRVSPLLLIGADHPHLLCPIERKERFSSFQATKEAVLPSLRNMERRLARDPAKAAAYSTEMEKLETAGVVAKIKQEDQKENRVNLNEWLLPGPTLSPSLVGVLLRFREHNVAISGDIKGMFHQVCLLPEDKPLMRFIWRSDRDKPPDIYEWQVLPFGTTCSPCWRPLPSSSIAKVIVQQLWAKHRDWDDTQLPEDLLQQWLAWEKELAAFTRDCSAKMLHSTKYGQVRVTREVHIFCDASERAYGSVAYLRSEDVRGDVHLSFLIARSRVAPKKQLSIPRLELCAPLTGAQLLKLLQNELTLQIKSYTLWSDSTTVLRWLHSTSCHFKVFVGTRIAEIQDLTEQSTWRYVDSSSNPSDDLTRGRTLPELVQPNRWSQGPGFLLLPADKWPVNPSLTASESAQDSIELKRSAPATWWSPTQIQPPQTSPSNYLATVN
ncbi:hypothetical protein WMY93_004167 [Mugilogobius chulae]|uniref:Peptidase aspartic putative domain-containing protein n=1 Tax=Mugilogobius chulae TaxID=88201 RepID=A0AAW0PRA9_9GOBI